MSTFEYGYTTVRELRVDDIETAKNGRKTIRHIVVDGQRAKPSRRFWKSFFARYHISENVFRYFEPSEVFARISDRSPNDQFRYSVERDGPTSKLLAVSNPNRPIIHRTEVDELVRKHGVESSEYSEGVVTSYHVPASGEHAINIGDDELKHRFVMETPIDGFGHPRIFLSMLRLVCANGAIGYSRAFRSDISLGKDLSQCIVRALRSFDNDEGYSALRQRFASSQRSWASVRECNQLYRILENVSADKNLRSLKLMSNFCRMTGNINELYGLANLDALSTKRQRVLPTRCRVYDLINFASEVATHYAAPAVSRELQAFIGSLISDEYDMEGTAETVADFGDFFVNHPDRDQRREGCSSLN